MPWNGTRLYLGEVAQNGAISKLEPIAGGATESIFQPEWSPDGAQIVLVSDRSGWWNLYSFDLATRAMRSLAPTAAEFGLPQWLLGMSTYAFAGPERIVCTYSQGGLGCLAVLDLANETLTPVATPFTEFGSMRAVALDLASGRHSVLKKATDVLDRTDLHLGDYLTRVERVEFPTTGGGTAFGLFYSPCNPDYAPGAEERSPLVVKCHGGPTSAASSTLNLGVQYWTSRGIAVLDVNYRGSTGFGRTYRDRLQLNWGVIDVDDCVAGARFLAAQGRVDGKRCVISGGSAGGYTTLAALTFRDFFQGGGRYYRGRGDPRGARGHPQIAGGPLLPPVRAPPPVEKRPPARAPRHHTRRLAQPGVFFPGGEDPLRAPNPAQGLGARLRRNGNPVG